ncbi:hypothetical protein E9549_12100 [Blastococcus sp. MG754426]|uniref:hypothetical protein n=1 Tax=unclassified Blastococcus TaxID=2619396 RepID=UPI001EF102ED|nr:MULTISPECIES: hypothetical protein [unclassified Blastococcus]MCF6508143.1 hypothetical protein [Blastococcus sp. MG754426]MCF6512248.1 hypothetical protein [Blastococcus sp. MG754427]
MSTPRDRDRDGFDDGDGRGWQEPPHLGGGGSGDDEDRPNVADRRKTPRDEPPANQPWQPPGWDLPAAEPDRPAPRDDAPPAQYPPPQVPPSEQAPYPPQQHPQEQHPPQGFPPPEQPAPRGLFGRRRRKPGAVERVFRYEGDLVGAQGWALQQGWTVSDGTAPQDAPLADLIASAPVRATKDHRAGNVLRGRVGTLELVAFDVVYASGRYLVPEYAITAVPMLGSVPGFRLSPARFWRHRTGGLVPVPSGDQAFDARWLLLAAEDDPRLRRLAQDPAVHALLLGSDDGDEFWSGAGDHIAAIRPDGHRPQLLEHHARLLTAITAALTSGY